MEAQIKNHAEAPRRGESSIGEHSKIISNAYRFLIVCIVVLSGRVTIAQTPWSHGPLRVSDNGTYLQHTDGTPFFWLGDTGWLLPEKLDRSEAEGYLQAASDAGYNVVQVQTINGVPAFNAYGQPSHPAGWDFSLLNDKTDYGYWDHMDYIIDTAARRGIYIGMVCIWGGLVKSGQMDVVQAKTYGKFLADRYKDKPNIVWIIGGDCRGDVKPEVWETLATTIKANDPGHLMTFHPFGRTSSAYWWHEAPWLDFNMFQSGHRRYDQTKGDGDDTAAATVAEDNWRYVADGLSRPHRKPIIDGEPSYEDIPQGLHDTTQPRWTAADARRYAYWSVLAGAAGHTYGHNSVMQMKRPGDAPAYGAEMPWYEAVKQPGYSQIRHLKNLMLEFPYFERVPDQSVILDNDGTRYLRPVASRGEDYILVYTYEPQPLKIDLTKIPDKTKEAWWMDPVDGSRKYIGKFSGATATFTPDTDHDTVLIIMNNE